VYSDCREHARYGLSPSLLYPWQVDTDEVRGSSPLGPTISFKNGPFLGRLGSVTLDDAAWFCARVLAVVDDLHAVNKNLGDTGCQLARLVESRMILDG